MKGRRWRRLGPDHEISFDLDVKITFGGAPFVSFALRDRGRTALSGHALSVPVTHTQITQVLANLPHLPPRERGELRALLVSKSEAIQLALGLAPLDEEATDDASFDVIPLSPRVERLLTAATDRLAPEVRDRWRRDWQTDALWLDGRWARLRFALGVRFFTVPRLRRAAAAAERHLPRRA